MRRATCWQALACALVLGGPVLIAAAQDKPLDRKTVDTHVFNTLRGIINHGADLFNEPNNDHNGCYRLYEGALIAVKPFLDHRPDLQKAIDDGLNSARTMPRLPDRAFALRGVIDKVRNATNPNPKPPTTATLWERLGGEANVKKVVDDFVAAAAPDPKVDFFRGGKYKLDADGVAKLKKMLVDQISSVSGGPYKYTGRSMKEVHKGMGITEEQFNALAGHLQAALKKNGAKDDDIKAVMTVIGGTKADIVEGKVAPPMMTLWDRLGGEANV